MSRNGFILFSPTKLRIRFSFGSILPPNEIFVRIYHVLFLTANFDRVVHVVCNRHTCDLNFNFVSDLDLHDIIFDLRDRTVYTTDRNDRHTPGRQLLPAPLRLEGR